MCSTEKQWQCESVNSCMSANDMYANITLANSSRPYELCVTSLEHNTNAFIITQRKGIFSDTLR